MNKPLKITLIIIGSVLVFFLLVALIVSPVAKTYVNNHGEELIGRKINVEHLRVNIYTGSVKIFDLAVYEDDATTKFLSLDTLDVSLKLRKLLSHGIEVRHLTLANLEVQVLQNGDKFNFTSILDHFKPTEEKPEDTTSVPWTMGFYNIRLSHWKVYYADKQLGSEWRLKDLNIIVPGVYFSGKENTDAGLTLALADGGTLNTQLKYNLKSNDFKADFKLSDFAISNIRAYLLSAMNVGAIKGTLAANIHAKGNLSQIMNMAITGNIALKGADLRDKSNNPVLQCGAMGVDVNKIVLADNLFDINSVSISDITSRFDLYADGSNFSRFFDVKSQTPNTTPKTTPEDTVATQSKPMKLSVGKFLITNANVTCTDHTLPDLFTFPVTKIRIEANNITLNGHNAARIMATLPHGGLALVDWRGSIDKISEYQDLRLDIKNLQLKDLSPYTVAYLGQPFTNGVFSFTSHNTIRHSSLKGDNHVDIYKPEVGKRRKDIDSALHIPLKAALYILKDKNDKVELNIPVSGNIDSPEFSYMKLVWKTLGNLFVKVATSPARGIADALGMGNSNLDFLPFEPLQHDFTSEQYYVMEQLSQVAKYDTNVVFTLEQQIADISDTAVATMAHKLSEGRNQAMRQQFLTLKVPSSQIEVTTATEHGKKTGYTITSRLKNIE